MMHFVQYMGMFRSFFDPQINVETWILLNVLKNLILHKFLCITKQRYKDCFYSSMILLRFSYFPDVMMLITIVTTKITMMGVKVNLVGLLWWLQLVVPFTMCLEKIANEYFIKRQKERMALLLVFTPTQTYREHSFIADFFKRCFL